MKKKLRKIVVEEQEYLWYLKGTVHPGSETGTLHLKIYRSCETKHPLLIAFTTWDDPVTGLPLNFGYTLYNRNKQGTEVVNLNQPRYIRQIILYASAQGWTGKNKADLPEGLTLLYKLGYDTKGLLPKLSSDLY